ncbi:hypothetical protein BKA65DRAFT_560828 [Rhexocercosporidium sp. MPI-PUGE-AT-0058]|nr:hypothetical protein BKA65DRAFT_560828 [Rhexocercosporidium sp. MPI-PUGE-AT-0058]
MNGEAATSSGGTYRLLMQDIHPSLSFPLPPTFITQRSKAVRFLETSTTDTDKRISTGTYKTANMVRINAKSVFGRVDLDDAASLRRVLTAMDYTLSDNVVDFYAQEIQNLEGEEKETTSVLHTTIRGQQLQGNTLLLRATLRFLESRNGSDEAVLNAARELENLADFEVFKLRVVHEEEYAAAEAWFEEKSPHDTYLRGHQTLFQRAPGAFGNQGVTSLVGDRLEEYRKKLNPTWYPSASTPPHPLNASSCERCKVKMEKCSRQEPACWKCRSGRYDCKYPAPSSMSKPDEDKGDDAPPRDVPKLSGKPKPDMAPSSSAERPKSLLSDSESELENDPAPSPASQTSTLDGIEPEMDPDATNSESDLGFAYEPEPEPQVIPPPAPKKPEKGKLIGKAGKQTPKKRAESDEEDEHEVMEDQSRISLGFNDTPANKPVRLPGRRIIDNGNYDRKPAVVGQMDPSKIVLTFDLEKVDKTTGKSVPDGQCHFKYRHTVKWDDGKSVAKLQRWRAQNFGRHLGPVRGARQIWLESERDLLFEVLQDHLAHVGGRWSNISWHKVADAYNALAAGKEQKSGARGAERLYNFEIKEKGKQKIITNVSKGQVLKKDRLAPRRTHISIRNQIKAFTHTTANKIIHNAKEEDRKARAKKGNGEEASPEPDSPADSENEDEETDDESTESALLDGDGSHCPGQDYVEDEDFDETMDKSTLNNGHAPSRNERDAADVEARFAAETAAAEEKFITGARARAKDLAGSRWLKGG